MWTYIGVVAVVEEDEEPSEAAAAFFFEGALGGIIWSSDQYTVDIKRM